MKYQQEYIQISTGVHSFVTINAENFDLTFINPDQIVIAKIENEIKIIRDIPDMS